MDFTLPESLAALNTAELAALEAEAVQAFDTLREIGEDDLTDANISDMERIAGHINTIRAEKGARVTAAQSRKDRAAAAAALVTATTETPEDPETPDEPVEPEPEPDPKPNPKPERAKRVTAAVEPVIIEGTVVSVADVPKPPVRRTSSRVATLTAAADVPGYPNGSQLESLRDAALAFSNRANGFPRGLQPDTYIRSGVATIERPTKDGLSTSNRDYETFQDLIDEAGKETRLSGGSLTAAGGWCAPSEVLYDLCQTESLDGLIDLPEIQINRGGIKFTKGPAFSDIYATAGFCQTEAQAIAGTAKPCVEVTCPTFQEIRLDVCGICVKAPILTNVGYPELVQRWIEGTLVAREHKESAQVIGKMVAAAGAAQVLQAGAGAGFDLLTALEWVGNSQKYKYRMSLNATLEVVLPYWAKAILRGDLALRDNTEISQITDQVIDNAFAQRGVRVQWVYDWQPLVTDNAAHSCIAAQPATIQALVYPAGTFVKGVADVINLDAVYDSVQLATNMYTAVFSESGYLVANRCYEACLIEIPASMCGSTGGSLDACLTMGDMTP